MLWLMPTTRYWRRRRLQRHVARLFWRSREKTLPTKKKALRKISIYLTNLVHYKNAKKDVRIDYHLKVHFHILHCVVVCFFFWFLTSYLTFWLTCLYTTIYLLKIEIQIPSINFACTKIQDFHWNFVRKKAGIYIYIFCLSGNFSVLQCKRKWRSEQKPFFMIGKIMTLTLTPTTKGCLSKT